jgi:hypothetical protein
MTRAQKILIWAIFTIGAVMIAMTIYITVAWGD